MSIFKYDPPAIAGNIIGAIEFAQQTQQGINNAMAGFEEVGVNRWSGVRKYSVNDFVSYNGEIYKSTVSNNTGNVPSTSMNWGVYAHKLKQNLSIYVSPNGSDSNDGSIKAPFATAEGVSNYINSINLGGFSVIVNVDGVFQGESGRFVFNKPCNGTICLQSKDINALSSITSIYISSGVNVVVRNIIFVIADTGSALVGLMVADYLSNLSVDGVIKIIDKTSVQQDVRPIFLSSKNSVIVVRTSIEVNTSSRVTFFNHIVRAENNANLSFLGGSGFSGSAQHLGVRYYVSTNSVINTPGAGENFIPGTGAGIAQAGGVYV